MVRLPLVRLFAASLLVAGASVAVADTLTVTRFRSTIEETSGIYRYTPTVARTETWGAREMRRMRDATRGTRDTGSLPSQQDFANAFKQDTGFGQGGDGLGSDVGPAFPVEGGSGGAGGPSGFDVGLALPSEVITSEEYLQLLTEIPEGAVKLADFVIAYTDGTRFLILNLKGIVSNEIELDWEAVLQNVGSLEGMQFKVKEEARAASKKEDDVKSSSAATTRRVVRSTFRIIVGVSIGVLLWFIVRKL